MATQTAVVTGGAGFLGSHLCDYLLAHGYRVVCVDNLETGSLENIAHIPRGPEFEFLYHDMVDHIVARVLDRFDIEVPIIKRWDGRMHIATKVRPAPAAKAKSNVATSTREPGNKRLAIIFSSCQRSHRTRISGDTAHQGD